MNVDGPQTDVAQALKFLEWLRPSGQWTLAAIPPDNKGFEARCFRGDATKEMAAWILTQGQVNNLYFHVNEISKDADRKAEKVDIAAMSLLHVDVDAREGEDVLSERERIVAAFRNHSPPPSAVVFSGGGVQAFWKLREPFALAGDEARIAEAERFTRQLEVVFEGDHCRNVDRLMRLPGTVNRPGAKKIKRGRSVALAEIVELTDAVYDLGDFTPAQPTQGERGLLGGPKVSVSGNIRRIRSVDELPEKVSDRTKILIVNGFDPDEPDRYRGDHADHDKSRAQWAVVCDLVKCGVDDDTIFGIITDPDLGISAHVLDQGPRAEAYAIRQIERAKEAAISPDLVEFNGRFAVIGNLGGRCRVIEWVDEQIGENFVRARISKQTFDDFRNRWLRRKAVGSDGRWITNSQGTPISVGKWWLQEEGARYYDRMAFLPGMTAPPDVLNLWLGFAVDARPGRCDRFLSHVRDNVCDGVEEHYEYLMDWLAFMFQKPANPGQVAVVLRGDMGVGKGYLARKIGRLVGQHFVHLSDSQHMTGHFNFHMRDALFVFADEAFYAGDKSHASTLKRMITEDTIMVTPKGVDSEMAPNYLHLMMASNESWVVPAGLNERRFFVLDVSAAHMQDGGYFDRIDDELDAGGYEALLHLLLTRDISGFDVRKVPKTRALQAQKIYSMTSDEEWWFRKLMNGCLLEDDDGWQPQQMILAMEADYTRYLSEHGRSRHGNATRMGQFVRKVCPGLRRKQLSGEHGYVDARGTARVKPRPYVWIFPELERCRDHFNRHHGGPYDWPDPPELIEEPSGDTQGDVFR